MSRLYNERWDNAKPIKMAFIDNGECPFGVSHAVWWLDHLCDLLQFLTDRPFEFAGIVTDEIPGAINHKYVATASGAAEPYDAWAVRRLNGSEIVGGLIQYREDRMPEPEKFSGASLHEVLHCLGVKHFNDRFSIMNNAPYNGYEWQANPMAADFYTFMMMFPGPMAPLWPTAFRYGKPDEQRCLIHIPSIMWQPGVYAAVWLYGKQEDGKWILEAPNYAIQHHSGYVGRTVASLKNDVLHIPLRYDKATVEVVAPMIQFTNPSSKVRFEVSEIHPLHVHSAFDI